VLYNSVCVYNIYLREAPIEAQVPVVLIYCLQRQFSQFKSNVKWLFTMLIKATTFVVLLFWNILKGFVRMCHIHIPKRFLRYEVHERIT